MCQVLLASRAFALVSMTLIHFGDCMASLNVCDS